MMDIPATKSSPKVSFTRDDSVLMIAGECYPENPFAFFEPIFHWLRAELPRMETLHLQVKVPYMNSSSIKCMLDLLEVIADHGDHGCRARVTWHYDEDNDRALELAEEFRDDIAIPFEILPVSAEDSML